MLVVFDWDGTLSDSIEEIVSTLKRASLREGLAILSDEQYRSVIGLSLDLVATTLYPEAREGAQERFAQAYREEFCLDSAGFLFPGVMSLIDELRGRGIKLAVATGKSRAGLDAALEASGLKSKFVVTVTATEARSKPDAQMIRRLMERTNALSAVMVGDSTLDVEMAVNARCCSVGVGWGVASVDALTSAGATTTVSDIPQLRSTLIKMIGS